MGNSPPTVINADAHLTQAGIVENRDKCEYVKCSPNISNFIDYNSQKNNNNFIRFCLIFLLFMYIFIWLFYIKK